MASSIHTSYPMEGKPSVAIITARSDHDQSGDEPSSLSEHLRREEFVELLGFIAHHGGVVTLDDLSLALPTVERPISAVLDLCDAGVLCADLAAAFSGRMLIWRKDG